VIYKDLAATPNDIPKEEVIVVFDADMCAKQHFFCKVRLSLMLLFAAVDLPTATTGPPQDSEGVDWGDYAEALDAFPNLSSSSSAPPPPTDPGGDGGRQRGAVLVTPSLLQCQPLH